jgi:flagellar hook-length control protein FliK
MIIQSANPVSALPGMESNGSTLSAQPATADNSQSFTANILQQLGLLQNNLANNTPGNSLLADTLASANTAAGGNSVQDFAALLGNNPPSASGGATGINLDDTMHTLADVLQYLQNLTAADAAGAEVTANSTAAAGQTAVNDATQNINLLNLKQTEQTPDPKALAAAAETLMQQIQQAQQKSDAAISQPDLSLALPIQTAPKSVLAQKSAPVELDQNALAAAVAAAMQQMQPQPVVQQATDSVLAGNQSVDNNLSAGNVVQMQNVVSVLPNTDRKALLPTTGAGNEQPQSAISNAGNESSVAQFSLGGAAQSNGGGQDASDNADKNAGDANSLFVSAAGKDSGNSPNNIQNDIAQLNQAVNSSKPVDAPPMTRPMGHPEWNQELSDKLIWMHKQDVPSAELRLNPEHLGPISIKIDVDQDQATVSFTAQHVEVRDAIEAAIPKLREMLGNQQLTLADVNVSQQQSEQNKSPYQAGGQAGSGNKSGQNMPSADSTAPGAVDVLDEIDAGRAVVSNGLLSLFA